MSDELFFTVDELARGMRYAHRYENVYDLLCDYEFKQLDLIQQAIFLDEFCLGNNQELSDKFKFDLENYTRTGNGYGLGKYLFQLVEFIQRFEKYIFSFDNYQECFRQWNGWMEGDLLTYLEDKEGKDFEEMCAYCRRETIDTLKYFIENNLGNKRKIHIAKQYLF